MKKTKPTKRQDRRESCKWIFALVTFITLRARRSLKCFKTSSLVDERMALVVKHVLLFKGREHGLEVASAPRRGLRFGFRVV